MENTRESPIIDESNNFNQLDYSEQLSDESSNSGISNNFNFISDEDSRATLIDQEDKIIELQNAEKYLDKELSITEKAIKPLFVQYIALQRHTLRRHLKVCRTMIKDLADLVESLNAETVPSRSLIQDERQLWIQELDKTYQRIINLKKYFLKAVTRADSSDYSMIKNAPSFVVGLKSTRSILHSNFETTYKYISEVHKMQKETTTTMEDVIKQHEVLAQLISKLMNVFPIANKFIITLGTSSAYSIENNNDTSPNRFTNQSTNTSNLLVIPDENLPPQQSEERNV